MKKPMIEIICMMLVGLLFTGCTGVSEEKVLIDTESLHVTTEGHRTQVTDLSSGEVYRFTTTRKRQGTGPEEPETAADTPTIRIEIEGPEIRITDKQAHSLYTLKPKGLCKNSENHHT